jgi:hypothetical protein
MRENAETTLIDDLITGHGGGLLWDLWKEPTRSTAVAHLRVDLQPQPADRKP